MVPDEQIAGVAGEPNGSPGVTDQRLRQEVPTTSDQHRLAVSDVFSRPYIDRVFSGPGASLVLTCGHPVVYEEFRKLTADGFRFRYTGPEKLRRPLRALAKSLTALCVEKYGDSTLQWQNVYIQLTNLLKSARSQGFTGKPTQCPTSPRRPITAQNPNLDELAFLAESFLTQLNVDGLHRKIGVGVVKQSAPHSDIHSAYIRTVGDHIAWIYSAASHNDLSELTDVTLSGHVSGFAPNHDPQSSSAQYDDVDGTEAAEADAHDEGEALQEGFAFGVASPTGGLDAFSALCSYALHYPVEGGQHAGADTMIVQVNVPHQTRQQTFPQGSELVLPVDLINYAISRGPEFIPWLRATRGETAATVSGTSLVQDERGLPQHAATSDSPGSHEQATAVTAACPTNRAGRKRSAAAADLEVGQRSTSADDSTSANDSTSHLSSATNAQQPAKRSSLTREGTRTGVPGKRPNYRHHDFPKTILPQGVSTFDIVDHYPDHLTGQVLDGIITSGDMSPGDIAKRLTENGHESERTNLFNKWKTYWKKANPGATPAEWEQTRKSALAVHKTQEKKDLRERNKRGPPANPSLATSSSGDSNQDQTGLAPQINPSTAALAPGHVAVTVTDSALVPLLRDRDENGELDGIHELVDDAPENAFGDHHSGEVQPDDNPSANHAIPGLGLATAIEARQNHEPWTNNDPPKLK